MSPSHHIKQSRRQLKFATRDTTAGAHPAAARSPARAASHAATAFGNHWHFLDGFRPSRRRLQHLLSDLAGKGYVSYSITGVLRAAYELPDRILRRTPMRVRRLLKGILKAMADEPNPITFEQALARAEADANPGPRSPRPTPICAILSAHAEPPTHTRARTAPGLA